MATNGRKRPQTDYWEGGKYVKKLYQSELVKAPVTLRLTSEVKRGRFGPYMYVRLESGEEAMLSIENESIAQILSSYPQNVPLTLKAYGSREKATIQVVEHTPERQNAVARMNGVPTPAPAKEPVFQQMKQCWEAAGRICPDDIAVRGTICNSMFIELNKSGRPLYGEMGASAKTPAPPPQEEVDFLDTVPGFKNHPGKTWRQIADDSPESVEWAIKNLRKLSEAEREVLRAHLEGLQQGAAASSNPFLQDKEQDELPF